MRTVGRVFGRLRATSAVNLVVDATLFLATVTVMLSGLMLSQVIAAALGVSVTPSVTWHVAHAWSANATIVFMLLHFALHASWFARVFNSLFTPSPTAARIPSTTPVFVAEEPSAPMRGFGGDR